MKNILLIFCIGLLFASVVSCKKDPKSDKVEVKTEVNDSIVKDSIALVEASKKKPTKKKKTKPKKKKKKPVVKKEEVIRVPPGAPSFTNVQARRYVRDYEAYITQYRKAVAANDMDSFLKLSDASSSLNRQYKSIIAKLSSEEMDMMLKYMDKKTKQIDALTKKMYD